MDMVIIARMPDGLPLAASIQENEQLGKASIDYQRQAKLLLKKLPSITPQSCSFESGEYVFHCMMEYDVCYLALCDRNFSKKLAYGFLRDISKEFRDQYGDKLSTCRRPYPFIEFDTYIQKTKKSYTSKYPPIRTS